MVYSTRGVWHHILCGTLAALTTLAPQLALAQQPAPRTDATPGRPNTALLADPAFKPKELNLKYVLPGACFVLAVRPAQVLKSPAAELMPTEVLQAALIKEVGIDPMTADQLVLSVVAPGALPPSYALYAGFDQPVTLKPSQLTAHTEPANLNGKPYWKSKEMMAPSILMLDDQAVLAAPEYALPTLTSDAAPRPNPTAAQFAASAHGDDLLAMLDLEPLRPLIQTAIAQGQKDIPPELREIVEIPNLVRTVELRINFSHPAVSEAIATANSTAHADRLVEIFEHAKELVAAQAAEQTQKALASDDPVEQASGRYSQRMTKYWNEQLQLQRDGDRIVLFRTDPAAPASHNQVVTVAVIGVLVALLLPAIQAAREAARRAASTNNMRMLMLGMLNYESAKRRFPPQGSTSADGKPLLSWRVHLLPYLEQNNLYQQFRLDEPWDSDNNKALLAQMPDMFRDPSSRLTAADGRTHYLGVAGSGKFFDPADKTGRSISSITDGTSNTIALVQVDDDAAVEWTKPEDWEGTPADPLAGLGSLRPGGVFLAAFCDGSVRVIDAKNIDVENFQALLTPRGGERTYDP